MEIVCRDTAQKMKDAGFPQPAPEFGQFWYDGDALNCIGFGDFTIHFPEMNMDGYVFAPTTTDILREIEGRSLTFFTDKNDEEIPFWWQIEYFDCINPESEMISTHQNPAEAAALAWLKKYER